MRSTAEGEFEIHGNDTTLARSLLQTQFIKQDLIENQFANLAINFPDAPIQRRDESFVLVKNLIRNFRKLTTQRFSILPRQILFAVLFEESSQNVVQQFAGINRL